MNIKIIAIIAIIALSGVICDKCCSVCPVGQEKVFVLRSGECGEGCIDPSSFNKIKVFESTLTLAPKSDEPACLEAGYPIYKNTETHGIPKILTLQCDFYTQPAAEFLSLS